jgi:hypothetical protein
LVDPKWPTCIPISDHHPCLISMTTDIPKAKVFQFKNYWLLHDEFMSVIQHGWNLAVMPDDRAKRLMAKFKNLRRALDAGMLTSPT